MILIRLNNIKDMKKFLFSFLYYMVFPFGYIHELVCRVKFGEVEWEDCAGPWTYMFVQTYLVDYVER